MSAERPSWPEAIKVRLERLVIEMTHRDLALGDLLPPPAVSDVYTLPEIGETSMPEPKPVLFEIVYDLHKTYTRNPIKRIENQQKMRSWGTRYPYTDLAGGITLQNGVYFRDMDELRDHFGGQGSYELLEDGEVVERDGKKVEEAQAS